MFRVAIIGGEASEDYVKFRNKCISCLKEKVKTDHIMILSPGDRYIDAFSERFKIDVKTFIVDWKKYGKDALKARAEEMLSQSDAVIVFDLGKKETNIYKKMASEKGIPLRVIL